MLNPLDYPIIFSDTEYAAPSAWWQHTPFARFLIALTRPSLLVELGTHYGISYFAFCQAVKALNIHTRCYAVDTWRGDEHAGAYGDEVLEQVQHHNAQHYGAFSSLLRMTFDEALQHFAEGEVDLLHIDGCHTYEAVQHDYESWLPKMSPRGVVLFHDINVREGTFGVWQLWRELRAKLPHFEFLHGYGLGVLAVGEEAPAALEPLLSLSEDEHNSLRQLFSQLGQRVMLRLQLRSAQQDSDEARAEIIQLKGQLKECSERMQAQQAAHAEEIERARDYIHHIETESSQRAAYLQQAEADMAELHKALAERQEVIEALQNEIHHIETESSQRAAYLQQAEAGIAELHKALAERQEVIEALQNEIVTLKQHLGQAQDELAALEGRLAESEAARTALEAQLARDRADLERLQRKLECYRSLA